MLFSLILAATLMATTPRHLPTETATGTHPAAELRQDMKEELPVVTSHGVTVGGKDLRYRATTGRLPVFNDVGESDASIFYVAYEAEQPRSDPQRPLIFFFNGGPGAASVWLHLGAAGPRRVRMLPDGTMPPPPYRLEANGSTWLDLADLVFVDPVGTGFSRAAKADQAQKFFTRQGDIDSLSRFIRLYLTRNKRWGAPLFLVGESYGAFRSAGLAEYLVEQGVALNGVILLSSVMNFQTISFDNGNDLPYALYLPSFTATAWYHRKLASPLQDDLDAALAAAERWAATDYLVALGRGDRLTPEERHAVARKVAEFTGFDVSFVEQRNLRIDRRLFVRELLRDRGKNIGTMDSRFLASDVEPASPHAFDPTVAAIRPPYTAMMNDYVRTELGYGSDLEYFTLGGGVGRWDFEAKNSYADTSDNLRNAFAKNPYMRLFVASGLFDLATPYAATDYTLSHLGLPPELRKNSDVHRYRAGHMMYLDEASLVRLKADVAEFIRKAVNDPPAVSRTFPRP